MARWPYDESDLLRGDAKCLSSHDYFALNGSFGSKADNDRIQLALRRFETTSALSLRPSK